MSARRVAARLAVAAALGLAGCGSSPDRATTTASASAHLPNPASSARRDPAATVDVYRAAAAGNLSPVVRGDPALVYVPNSLSNTVDVISQRTLKIIRQFPTGALPQHVTPAWDLKTLYVDNDVGNTLTPIDPRTGVPGRPIPSRIPTTCTSPRTAGTRSSSPNASSAWISGSLTRCA